MSRERGADRSDLRARRSVHWRIVKGRPISPREMPLALQTAEELSGRLWRGILTGFMFGIIMAIYIPESMPPTDLFSWSLLIGAFLAIGIYIYGLWVVLRARRWLNRHRAAG